MSPTPTMTATATTGATGTPGATSVAGTFGHIHYFMDTTVPMTQGVPAVTQTGTWLQTASTTFTWMGVPPGTHIFSAELVNPNHTPLSQPIVATSVITLPPVTATPSATTPAATATASPTATTAATGTPGATATMSPTATMAATGTPGATATMSPTPTATANATTGATATPGATSTGNITITQISCQLGTAGAAATGSPTPATGRTVTFSWQATGVGSTNKIDYFMDMMVSTDPNIAPSPSANMQQTSLTSVTWNNVMPGAHAFSGEIMDADGTPMAPVVEATIIITVPGVTSATATPGATATATPGATSTMTPSATATRTP